VLRYGGAVSAEDAHIKPSVFTISNAEEGRGEKCRLQGPSLGVLVPR
jgi:hypothetical protein